MSQCFLQARRGVNYNEQLLATSRWRAAAQPKAGAAPAKAGGGPAVLPGAAGQVPARAGLLRQALCRPQQAAATYIDAWEPAPAEGSRAAAGERAGSSSKRAALLGTREAFPQAPAAEPDQAHAGQRSAERRGAAREAALDPCSQGGRTGGVAMQPDRSKRVGFQHDAPDSC